MRSLRASTRDARRLGPRQAFIHPGEAHWVLILAVVTGPLFADADRDGAVVGVMTHFAQGWQPELAGSVAGAGVRNIRDELYWQDIEPVRGRYVFPERYERYMGELRHQGVSPLIELDFANRAYDGGNTPYDEDGFQGYARYGVALLRHYGGQIGSVELWNEYNGSFCTGPALADRAGTYSRMIRVAYRALKTERPALLIAGGATAGVPLPYLERVFAAGGLDSMDAVSVHPYRYDSPPEGIEEDIAGLQRLIQRYNHGNPKPVWVTELGWGTKAASAPLDLAIDERTQASFLIRSYALLISAGVERIYWYLFRDYDAFATMGLVRNDRRQTPKAAYWAMKTMIAQVGGAHFVRREPTAPDFYSMLFRRDDGGEVRVIWSLMPRAITVPSAGAAVDMMGAGIGPGNAVAIGGEPVFVVGPVEGLPPPDADAPAVVADSVRDFSGAQGSHGWSYGMFIAGSGKFVPSGDFRATDWKREWYSRYPYFSLTDRDQHPAQSAAGAVAAVRRWTSSAAARIRVDARFRCGAKGDGVRVKVLLDGREAFSGVIGGPHAASAQFNSVEAVAPGGHIDFAVFPGPHGNANFDATEVSVTISDQM
jgi:Glycosyl hydrolase catalytic core